MSVTFLLSWIRYLHVAFIQLKLFLVNFHQGRPKHLHFTLIESRLPANGGFTSEQALAWVLMPLEN